MSTENAPTEAVVVDHVRARLVLGRQRYGHGVRVRDGHDWVRELREELFDAVVYAAANCLKYRPESPDEPADDDNEAILDLVQSRLTAKYDGGGDLRVELLDLCLFAASGAEKLAGGNLSAEAEDAGRCPTSPRSSGATT